MDPNKIKSVIESLLFVSGEPVSIKKLAKTISVKEEEIEKALKEFSGDLKDRGLLLVFKDKKVQLSTSPSNAAFVEKYLKEDLREDLSRAASEALAIIAYRGPITRFNIEAIRGVNSSFILRALLIRGLVERIPNPKNRRSFLYRISFQFLNKIGLSKKEELPDYEKLHKDKRFDKIINLGGGG